MKTNYSVEWLKEQLVNDEVKDFLLFEGKTTTHPTEVDERCLSRKYESSFKVNGIVYKTAEHWMMAQRARLFHEDKLAEAIIAADSIQKVQQLSREVNDKNEVIWKERRFDLAVEGNIHKFSQNPELKRFLLNTDEDVLVEANKNESVWGIGMGVENPKATEVFQWKGRNLLGFALMEVRDRLAA
ncbi:NADAR family protein [Pustulibacterium marinum]|nr:NADAR family protein [Pustulibacterium marinum]